MLRLLCLLSLAAALKGISTQKANDGVESTIIPFPAVCMPEPRIISFRTGSDLSEHYTPSCTRVERCGGCCPSSEFFSCQPTKIQILKMKVKIHKFTGGNSLALVNTTIIPVERHLMCKCDCIVKEKDCNLLQKYVKQQCKCVCINDDEREKCMLSDPRQKFWDSNECTCKCLIPKECTTGYVFNKHTCSCEIEQRQLAGQHTRDYFKR